MSLIYKIVSRALWAEAERAGCFAGAANDISDGFIHFSSGAQLEETAAKHFAGQTDLQLVAVEPSRLGDALRWEVSRGGALFPHLYAALRIADVAWVRPLPDQLQGRREFGDVLK